MGRGKKEAAEGGWTSWCPQEQGLGSVRKESLATLVMGSCLRTRGEGIWCGLLSLGTPKGKRPERETAP